MWDISNRSSPAWTDEQVVPSEVLYEFDGPLIFLSRTGLTESLFCKVDEVGRDSLYLIANPANTVIDALRSGKISVRGALHSDQVWIAQIASDLRVVKYWATSFSEVPERILPEAGVPLYSHMDAVPDTIEQANSFFALKFTGNDLSEKFIMFSALKSLVDNAHESIRRILTPIELLGFQNNALDFRMYQPKLGSLVIAVDEPVVDPTRIGQDRDKDDQLVREISLQVMRNRDAFFKDMQKVVDEANNGDLSTQFALENFDVLSYVNEIVPTERRSRIERVEFNASLNQRTLSVAVSEEIGDRLRKAHNAVEKSKRTHRGVIIEINARSNSLIIVTTQARQMTCKFKPDVFDLIRKDIQEYRIGAKIVVEGLMRARRRRDLMYVEDLPRIVKGELA